MMPCYQELALENRKTMTICPVGRIQCKRVKSEVDCAHTAVQRGARAQFPPKLSLNKVLNFPNNFRFQAQS